MKRGAHRNTQSHCDHGGEGGIRLGKQFLRTLIRPGNVSPDFFPTLPIPSKEC
jgi:hypothetical protein